MNNEQQKLTESRAVFIRRMYRRDDGWHAINNAQLGKSNDPNHLMGVISALQVQVTDAYETFKQADKALADAQGARLAAEESLSRLQTELDIRLLALAELLDIPG